MAIWMQLNLFPKANDPLETTFKISYFAFKKGMAV